MSRSFEYCHVNVVKFDCKCAMTAKTQLKPERKRAGGAKILIIVEQSWSLLCRWTLGCETGDWSGGMTTGMDSQKNLRVSKTNNYRCYWKKKHEL